MLLVRILYEIVNVEQMSYIFLHFSHSIGRLCVILVLSIANRVLLPPLGNAQMKALCKHWAIAIILSNIDPERWDRGGRSLPGITPSSLELSEVVRFNILSLVISTVTSV